MKVLLINSDLAKNRGDRAIAEGLVDLIRLRYPGAEITGLSEENVRDERWFGIRFLKSDVYTVNPFAWLNLLREAHRSDVVYWGGGEVLKDYTNKAALWYWAVKIFLVRLVNKNIYGSYQGIGPTEARHSRWLVRKIVEMTKRFAVRDQESYDKLIDWGTDEAKVLSVADPAVYPNAVSESDPSISAIKDEISSFGRFAAIAPRNWFHYEKGKILPHRMRKALGHKDKPTEDNNTYISALVEAIEHTSKTYDTVVLVPMHMSEDVSFCRMLAAKCQAKNIVILEDDVLSPADIRYVLAQADIMIGFRLHSNIIATSGYTPCLNYYYVDKGRAYFDQIEQSEFCFPIEDLLESDFIAQFSERLDTLTKSSTEISELLESKIEARRQVLTHSIEQL